MPDFNELVKNLYTSKNRELTQEKLDYINKNYVGKEEDFVKNFYATIGEDLPEEKFNYIRDTYLKKNVSPNQVSPTLPSFSTNVTQTYQTPLKSQSPLASNLSSVSEKKEKQINPFTAPIEEINKAYKEPTNLDLLKDINAKSQERVNVLKNRIGLLGSIKQFQAQAPQIEQDAAQLSEVVQDARQPLQVRQQAQEKLKEYQSQFDKFNQDVEAYKGLIDSEKKIVSDINQSENIRQKGLEKDWGFVKGLSEAIQSSTIKTLGGTAAMFNSLGLSGDPENPDPEVNAQVQQEVRNNTQKINEFGNSLVTQEIPKNFEKIFEGNFSTNKLKYILAQGLGQTAPTVAAGFLGGAGGAAITGAGLGFTESKDIFKKAGLSEKQSDVAALGLAIPLGLLEEWGVSDIITKPIGKLIIKETTEDVVKNLAKKELTNEVLFNTVKKTLGDKLKEYSIDVAKAAWKEPLTEMEQATLSEGAKQAAELYTGKDSNANQTMSEYLKETGTNIAEEGIYGLAGGAGMSAITSALQNRTTPNAYERAIELKNPELLQDFTEQLDEEVSSGRLTTQQANTALENVKKIQEVDTKIPDNIKGAERRSIAASLITKKEELIKQIEGKDPILAAPIIEETKQIDNKLAEIAQNKPIEIIEKPLNEQKAEISEVEKEKPKENQTTTTPSSSNNSEVQPLDSVEKDIQLSGLVDGFKGTTYNSFDVRDNTDVMKNISDEKSFITKTTRKGKEHIVVGIKINNIKGNTVGRDGYSFATIEDNGNLPSNINELLINKAKENAAKLYPNVKDMTFKDIDSEVSAPSVVEEGVKEIAVEPSAIDKGQALGEENSLPSVKSKTTSGIEYETSKDGITYGTKANKVTVERKDIDLKEETAIRNQILKTIESAQNFLEEKSVSILSKEYKDAEKQLKSAKKQLEIQDEIIIPYAEKLSNEPTPIEANIPTSNKGTQTAEALRDVESTGKAFTAEGGNKVVNEKGEPITVYHTTTAENIQEFRTSGEIETLGGKVKNEGAYFTPNKGEYANKGGKEYAVQISIKNPYITTDQIESAIISPKKKAELVSKGHDGVILMRNGKPAEYIVFDKSQIKSESLLSKEQTNERTPIEANIPTSNKGTQTAEPTKQESEGQVKEETTLNKEQSKLAENQAKEPIKEEKTENKEEIVDTEIQRRDNLVNEVSTYNKLTKAAKASSKGVKMLNGIKTRATEMGFTTQENKGKLEVINVNGKRLTKSRTTEEVAEPTQEARDNFKKLFKEGVIVPSIVSQALEPTQIRVAIEAFKNGKETKDVKRLINEFADFDEDTDVKYREWDGNKWVGFSVPLSEMLTQEVDVDNLTEKEINELADVYDEMFANIDEETQTQLTNLFYEEQETRQQDQSKDSTSSKSSTKAKGTKTSEKVVKAVEKILENEFEANGSLSKDATIRTQKRNTAVKQVKSELDTKEAKAVETVIANYDKIRDILIDKKLIKAIDCKWAK
jgi:hypothetical protein